MSGFPEGTVIAIPVGDELMSVTFGPVLPPEPSEFIICQLDAEVPPPVA